MHWMRIHMNVTPEDTRGRGRMGPAYRAKIVIQDIKLGQLRLEVRKFHMLKNELTSMQTAQAFSLTKQF